LGGTGSANYLDDYEEGTWTPTYGGSTGDPTVTYDTQSGDYTKVGSLVTVRFELGTDAVSGGSGNILINGLPFPVSDTTYFRAVSYNFAGSNSTYNSDRPDIIFCQSGTSYMRLWTASTVNLTTADLDSGGNSNRLFGVVSYYTS